MSNGKYLQWLQQNKLFYICIKDKLIKITIKFKNNL